MIVLNIVIESNVVIFQILGTIKGRLVHRISYENNNMERTCNNSFIHYFFYDGSLLDIGINYTMLLISSIVSGLVV